MSEVVKLERHDVIAIVTVNSPPVNALSAAVRGGIFECMKSAIADAEVKAIVLTCGGRTFIAGADITEFGKPPKPPGLAEVLVLMENSPKPIIAAIHGTALGGGLEVALACHYRVATKEARLGLPEVKLGLLPGAGGTQRLPRAVGPELAVKMIVGGDPISAAEAQKNGLIEEIVEGPASGGEAFARKVLAEKRPLRKLRDDDSKLAAAKADISIFTNAVAALTKKARGLEAPFAAADAVRAAIELPFDEGLKKEREGFLKLVSSDQSKAQRYAFFSEREAAKIAGVPEGTKPRQCRARRHHRRRHHGRRYRDVVRQCRYSGDADRDQRRAAQARHGRDAEELRGDRRARRHPGGCAGQAHGPDHGRGRPGERQGC